MRVTRDKHRAAQEARPVEARPKLRGGIRTSPHGVQPMRRLLRSVSGLAATFFPPGEPASLILLTHKLSPAPSLAGLFPRVGSDSRHRNQSACTLFKRWAYRSRCVPGSVAAQTRMRAGTTGKPPRCSSPLSPAALWRGFFIRVASDFRHSNQKLGSAFSRWLAVQRRSPFSRVSFLVLGSGAGRQALCELTSARFGGAFRVSVPVRRATDDASAALSGGLAANALSPFSPKWRAAGVRSARPATPLFVVTAGHLEGRDVVEEIGCCDRRAG